VNCSNAIRLLLAAVAVAAVGCAESVRPPLPEKTPLPETRAAAARNAAAADATLDEAMMLIAEQQYAEALKKLPPVVAAFEAAEDRDRAARTTFWMAYCQEKSGKQAEAIALYGRVARAYPQTAAARLAAERLARLRSPPATSPAASSPGAG
jgi:tetratricopeptide (TPR) repeat protein